MELIKENKKLRCDVSGCKNMSNYYFEFRKGFKSTNLYLCQDCLKDMYSAMGKHIVPTSIKNVYKKSKVKNEDK